MLTRIHYGGLPSNTQMVERGNKIHNQGATNSREAISVNGRVTFLSILVDFTSVTSCDGKRKASSGRAHTKDVFQKLADHNNAEKECKSKFSQEEVKHRFDYIKEQTFIKSETFEEKQY